MLNLNLLSFLSSKKTFIYVFMSQMLAPSQEKDFWVYCKRAPGWEVNQRTIFSQKFLLKTQTKSRLSGPSEKGENPSHNDWDKQWLGSLFLSKQTQHSPKDYVNLTELSLIAGRSSRTNDIYEFMKQNIHIWECTVSWIVVMCRN